MPLTRELTVAGVRLVKHVGDEYHYYRGSVQGFAVTFRPTINHTTRRPEAWTASAEIPPASVATVASGDTLRHTVQGAVRNLTARRERQFRRQGA